MTMMDDWIDEVIGGLVRERDSAREKMISANCELVNLHLQLEVAVEALRRIYRDDGSMYSLIAHEALAEIERIGAEK